MRGEETPRQWLAGSTDGTPHRAAALEELLLLWTANRNEAFSPSRSCFEDKTLAEKTVYRQVTQQLAGLLRHPAADSAAEAPSRSTCSTCCARRPWVRPRSLSDQLALIRRLWKPLLGDSLERFLLLAGEILREEELAIWMQFNPPDPEAQARRRSAGCRGARRERGEQQWPSVVSHAEVPVFGDPAHEYEKFSPDTAWMPTPC